MSYTNLSIVNRPIHMPTTGGAAEVGIADHKPQFPNLPDDIQTNSIWYTNLSIVNRQIHMPTAGGAALQKKL
jgi:hypothetical protein